MKNRRSAQQKLGTALVRLVASLVREVSRSRARPRPQEFRGLDEATAEVLG